VIESRDLVAASRLVSRTNFASVGLEGFNLGLVIFDEVPVSLSKFWPGLRLEGYGIHYITDYDVKQC